MSPDNNKRTVTQLAIDYLIWADEDEHSQKVTYVDFELILAIISADI